MDTKFLHVADIHLDSPLAHLRKLDPAAATRLQAASRTALERVVATAIENSVSAVVVAGDLFDAPVEDASAGIWVESQFRKLVRAEIPVILIRGNHDALSNARRVIDWSDGVHELSSCDAESIRLDAAGLAVHGQSFGNRVVADDIASQYPDAIPGLFNIGVLHTSLAGNPNHDTYAPTSISVLESKGYDYWALGHIHARSEKSLSDKCYVGYSGITQGRHIRETGSKGCHLVSIQDGQLSSVEFVPTDSLRWYELVVELDNASSLGDIEELVIAAAESHRVDNPDVELAVRVRLSGATPVHAELTSPGVTTELSNLLSDRLSELGPVWLEKIKISTRPLTTFDADALVRPLGYIERVATQLKTSDVAREGLEKDLDDLMRKARGELQDSGLSIEDDELAEIVSQAEDLLVARLTKEVQ
ncbi:MAG: DNA repair exonuclease [Aureliella sp.]